MAATRSLAVSIDVRPASDVKAEALREAADLLYTDDGPDRLLSTATWLRERADMLERGEA